MTQGEFSGYLLFVALFAGVMGVVNLLRPHKRWLGAGAILFGAAALTYRQGVPLWGVATVCGFGLACLLVDVGTRSRSTR